MIYAIQIGQDGPIKFGRAKSPWARMAELQTAQPEPLRLIAAFPLPDYREKMLHDWLSDERIRGEWFKPSKPCLSAIKLLQAEVTMDALGYSLDEEGWCQCCELEIAHSLAHGLWVDPDFSADNRAGFIGIAYG